MAIQYDDILNFTHYEYGEPFPGSYKGMRYRIARNPLENVHFVPVDKRGEATLQVAVWPEPFAYDTTKEEKTIRDFPFTEEGRIEAVDWLNATYEEKFRQ